MAPLRKASAYSKRKVVPFTRVSKKRQKSFIKAVPQSKIVKFTMGKTSLQREGKFPHELKIISTEKVQIRHNALEACRQYINKKLNQECAGQYFFRVIPFPHHVQRENKMLAGAGADRMQSGMRHSYGKAAGKSAIVKEGSGIFFIAVPTTKAVTLARKTIKQVKSKLPCKIRIEYKEIKSN